MPDQAEVSRILGEVGLTDDVTAAAQVSRALLEAGLTDAIETPVQVSRILLEVGIVVVEPLNLGCSGDLAGATESIYARPTDELLPYATSIAATNENAAFPVANLTDRDPANVFKATTTSTTITMTWSGSVTAVAFAIINHNLVGATVILANDQGYSQPITIPARTDDQLCVNAWRDMRSDANRTAAVWTLTITGASASVYIGELVMVCTLRPLNWTWGPSSPGVTHWIRRPADVVLSTRLGATHVVNGQVQVHGARGVTKRRADKEALLALWHSARGGTRPWLVIDQSVGEPWLVSFRGDTVGGQYRFQNAVDATWEFEELSMGPPL